jgi:hypothetical protein
MAHLNKLKAKVVMLHNVRVEETKFDLDYREAYNNERASIYNIQQKKRMEQWPISMILGHTGSKQTTNKENVGVFHEFLRSNFKTISEDADCVRLTVVTAQGRRRSGEKH